MLNPLHQSIVCPVLVGRDTEIAALHEFVRQTAGGQGDLVLISGEAGVGKSRLATELGRFALDHGFQLLEGQCFPADRSCPYAPLLDLIHAFLAPLSPAQVTAALGPSLGGLMALLPEAVRHLPDVARLAPMSPLDPEQEQRRLFMLLADVFVRAAASRPLLLIVEDIHWSDESTLEFLLFFAHKAPAHRLLLVLTYRSEETSQSLRSFLAQVDRERRRQEVVLGALDRTGGAAMLSAIVRDAVPSGLFDALYDLTEGNPFILEEMLTTLIAAGDLVESAGGWHWARSRSAGPVDWQLPGSLQEAIDLRLNGLTGDARRALQMAAVAGRRFDFALLQRVTQQDEPSLLAAMKQAMAAQLVVEVSADQFGFRHALTQQAIAAGLLARERRALHQTIAETLEQQRAEALEASLGDLAYHFAEAECWNKALEYAQRAAEQAQVRSAPRAALEQWTRVIAAAEHLGKAAPAQVYHARAKAHETLGDFEQAEADYERSLEAARQDEDGQQEWQTLVDLGFLWTGRDYRQAGGYFQQALELASHLTDARLQAHSLNRRANWLLNTGQIAEAMARHHEALALFEALQDQPGMAETLDLLGTVALHQGDMIGAVQMYGRAIELLRAVGNRAVLCSCLTMRASCACPWAGDTAYTVNWDLAACERDLVEALGLARDLEWAAGEAFAQIVFGGVLASFGQFGRALAHGQQGLRLATEIEHQQWIAGAHNLLARIFLSLLAHDRALSYAEAGLQEARALGSDFWIGELIDVQVQAYAAMGLPDQAQITLREVQPEAPDPAGSMRPGLLLTRAELALLQRRPEVALECCEPLFRPPPEVGDTVGVMPRLWKCRGEALAALGRVDEAVDVLEQARRGAQLQQYLPLLWQIERSLGRVAKRQGRPEEALQIFASARRVIALLAEGIDEPALREHFEQWAFATLPREKRATRRRAVADQFGGLTEREREVAALIGQGKSNAEIAELLVVSKRTVETYVSNVLSKLGLASRSQIALWTRESGLVAPGPRVSLPRDR